MGILHGEARAAAALLVSFTVSCVSTSETLFRDDPSAEQFAEREGVSPSTEPASTVAPPAPARVASPEQLVVSDLDDAPREAAGAGNDAAGPDDAAAMVPVPPPAEPVAIDPCAFGNAILCDTFEDAEENTFPSSASWLPELGGCGTHRVDGTGPSFSGTRALRADDGAYPECMLHADLSDEVDVYVRTRVFIGGDDTGGDDVGGGDIGGDGPGIGGPGLGGAAPLSQYLSLVEFGSREAQDDPELRIGVRPASDSVCPGAPGLDVSGGGLVGGAGTECTGFVLEPERWYCIEVHLARAGRDLSVNVSVDGTELSARDFTGSAAWATSGLFLKVGRASYGASGRGSLWHDDVAVGREPVPCGP